jgi:hypothetical protein
METPLTVASVLAAATTVIKHHLSRFSAFGTKFVIEKGRFSGSSKSFRSEEGAEYHAD